MRVTAVIAEYNPLHNGHVMHMETAHKAAGADYVVAVMSGDYVQRGCPSIISKYERTRSILMAGADLVVELPVQYSTGSLEYFAMGAVSLIQNLGIVDCISFGSECGDIELLKEASEYIEFRVSSCENINSSSLKIRDCLTGGHNYSHAVNSLRNIPPHLAETLSTPNNLLAAAYIRAAGFLSFDCDFHTMKRTGSDYHDVSEGALSSSSLRKELLEMHIYGEEDAISQISFDSLASRMPDNIYESLCKYLKRYPPISENDFSLLLFHKLQAYEDDPEGLTAFLDVSSSLAHKIIREYAHAASYSELCMKLKSRDLNYARISRSLLHILLDIKASDIQAYINDGRHYYIKPLGFRRSSSALLHGLKLTASVPVISKYADAEHILRKHYMPEQPVLFHHAVSMFREGILASDLYNKTACSKCRQPFLSEYERSMIII